MKFHVITLGCQMNYSDTARIKSVLKNCGFDPVETIAEADIVIFDTCSVRQKSEDKVTGKLSTNHRLYDPAYHEKPESQHR